MILVNQVISQDDVIRIMWPYEWGHFMVNHTPAKIDGQSHRGSEDGFSS